METNELMKNIEQYPLNIKINIEMHSTFFTLHQLGIEENIFDVFTDVFRRPWRPDHIMKDALPTLHRVFIKKGRIPDERGILLNWA